ncbi:MAG: hypothetical protein R3C26_15155 [Calditrichia bacterium]
MKQVKEDMKNALIEAAVLKYFRAYVTEWAILRGLDAMDQKALLNILHDSYFAIEKAVENFEETGNKPTVEHFRNTLEKFDRHLNEMYPLQIFRFLGNPN